MSFALVGKVWDAESFDTYVKKLDLSWAKGITVHHTFAPSLAQRPHGLKIQHIRNIASFYKRKGWTRGPHLFTDEDQIFGMSPLTSRSIHAKSFNATHLSIETLGNYDEEETLTGRGLLCWQTTAQACASIIRHHPHITVASINGHRDDPKTNKSCPGKKVNLDTLRASITALLEDDNFEAPSTSTLASLPRKELEERIGYIQYQLNKLKDLI